MELQKNLLLMINEMGFDKKMTLNEREAAEVIGVSVSSLYKWRKEGIGPEYINIAMGKKGRIMYPKTAIAEWLAKTTIKTA